jgi:hypothetical protein
MVVPPSAHSLEGGDQFFNGGGGQNGGLKAGFGREVGAGDRDIGDLAREDFNLAMTDMARQNGEPREREGPAVEGMTRIGDGDLTLAFLRH